MGNSIKYTANSESLALKKGNFYIGTGDVAKGPTSSTGFYKATTPPEGGYRIYIYNTSVSGNIAYHTAANDSELISFTNNLAGQSYTTVNECLVYYASQTDKVVLNRDYEGIVTDGLIFNLDAGFTPSYPTSGTTWGDISLSGNNGTLTNGPTYSTDGGGSIVFDGVDDYINMGNVLNLDENPFTISAWFKYTYDGGYHSIIAKGTGLGTSIGYRILIDNNGKFYVDASDGNTENFFTSNFTITSNEWTHVSFVRESLNTFKLYVNGVLDKTVIKNIGSVSNNYNLYVGAQTNNSFFFTGTIGQVIINNKALTETEILQNYNAQKGRFGL